MITGIQYKRKRSTDELELDGPSRKKTKRLGNNYTLVHSNACVSIGKMVLNHCRCVCVCVRARVVRQSTGMVINRFQVWLSYLCLFFHEQKNFICIHHAVKMGTQC